MRFSLWFLCILFAVFASALFFMGYDGAQIREYLLGVSAVILVATRLLPPPDKAETQSVDNENTNKRREQRLSDSHALSDDESETEKPSESRNSP